MNIMQFYSERWHCVILNYNIKIDFHLWIQLMLNRLLRKLLTCKQIKLTLLNLQKIFAIDIKANTDLYIYIFLKYCHNSLFSLSIFGEFNECGNSSSVRTGGKMTFSLSSLRDLLLLITSYNKRSTLSSIASNFFSCSEIF